MSDHTHTEPRTYRPARRSAPRETADLAMLAPPPKKALSATTRK